MVLINDMRQPRNFTAAWTATVGGKERGPGPRTRQPGGFGNQVHPHRGHRTGRRTPAAKADGQITLAATIGDSKHQDTFAFRVFGEDKDASGEIAAVDPEGLTGKMLARLGYKTRSWNGGSAPLVVIGRNGLEKDAAAAAKLEAYVQAGGRALIFAQDPDWMARAFGWRVCPKVARRVFPVDPQVAGGLDADDLRDWNGSSTLLDPYPQYEGDYLRGNERDQPYAGWHWGNRGGVSSAAVEKPHRSGWRPLLECEFDLATRR